MNRVVWLVATFLLAPAPANAHLAQTGLGPFYDGVAHLAMAPGDGLAALGLGLLAGLRGARAARDVLLVLPSAWLLGGVVGLPAAPDGAMPLATPMSFGLVGLAGLVGLVVALDRELPRPLTTVAAGTTGLLHGYANGAAMSSAGVVPLALAGETAMAFIVVTLVPAVVLSLRAGWLRVAVRVAGSWIAAISMLMLGWLAKGT